MLSRLLFGSIFCASLCCIAASNTWTLRFDGIGPVKVGMNISQLNAALQEIVVSPKDKDSQACFYVDSAKHPGIAFMLENRRVTRVDLIKPDLSTTDGFHIGDSENHLMQKYGQRLKVEPHQYVDNGHYLTLRSTDGKNGIRFETDTGKIISIYAGRLHAIEYIEGCN